MFPGVRKCVQPIDHHWIHWEKTARDKGGEVASDTWLSLLPWNSYWGCLFPPGWHDSTQHFSGKDWVLSCIHKLLHVSVAVIWNALAGIATSVSPLPCAHGQCSAYGSTCLWSSHCLSLMSWQSTATSKPTFWWVWSCLCTTLSTVNIWIFHSKKACIAAPFKLRLHSLLQCFTAIAYPWKISAFRPIPSTHSSCTK